MGKILRTLVIFGWLFCGYIGASLWAGHFYGEYGGGGIETKGSASRSACIFIWAGPIYLFVAWTQAEYPPMWDWPKHIFEYEHRRG